MCTTTNAKAGGVSCTGTTCAYTCAPGFADCTTGSAPDLGGCATPTTTTSNCGGCNNVCTPNNASADSCNGLTCSYTCNSGYVDCDKTTAPDTNGCECAGTACCPGGCQTAHSNGMGQTFYDCNPTKTYTPATALEACNAYGATLAGWGTTYSCGDGWWCSGVNPTLVCVQNMAGTVSYAPCWAYSTTKSSGTAGVNLQGDVTGDTCPYVASATWN